MTDITTVAPFYNIISNLQLEKPQLQIKELSSNGGNFTSKLYSIVATDSNKVLKLFAKVAIHGKQMRSILNINEIYKKEILVYTNLRDVYKELEYKNNVTDLFVFPKFYGANTEPGEEVIVIEDLEDIGYQAYNRFARLDWDFAASAIENLVKFHALSFIMMKEKPEEFKKFIVENNTSRPDEDFRKETRSKLIMNAVDVVNDELKEHLMKFLKGSRKLFDVNIEGCLHTLVYGGFKPSNLMYRKQKIHARVR